MADDHGSEAFAYFLIGAAVGAVAAILLTPRSGRETREFLADQGTEVAKQAQKRGGIFARRAQDLASDVQNRAEGWLDRGRDLVEGEAQRVRDAFQAGRDAMREEIRGSGEPPRT
ncbi:MAG: YtxH domain-containing protein [Candidatus Rokuibacteriota bacterium]